MICSKCFEYPCKKQGWSTVLEGICIILSNTLKGTPFLHQGVTKCVIQLFITAWWRKPVPFEIWDKIMHIPSNVWSVNCLSSMAFNYLTSSFSFRILRCSLSTLLESDLKLLYWNNVGTELATNGGFPLSPNSSACKMSSSITTNQMLVM